MAADAPLGTGTGQGRFQGRQTRYGDHAATAAAMVAVGLILILA